MLTSTRRSRAGALFVLVSLLVAVVSGLMVARVATRDPGPGAVAEAAVLRTPGIGAKAAGSDPVMITATIRRMLAAMQAGDVSTVRRLSCGEFSQAFAGPAPQIGDAMRQAYTAVSFAVAEIENVQVDGNAARADAVEIATHHDTGQTTRSVEQFVLERHGAGWKVCDSH